MSYRLNQEASAVAFDWTFDLRTPPAELWPYVSDTNRMNLLAGMGVVKYSEFKAAAGGARRIGEGKLMGLSVRWEEHPFRWVHGERYHVMRTFLSGPLSAYRLTVVLEPHGEGTRITHRVRVVPRNVLTRPLVSLEGAKAEKRWRQAYAAVDDALARKAPHPFFQPIRTHRTPAQGAIAERLVREGQDRALVDRLVDHVIGATELEVQHIRPFALAERWQAPRLQLLELCLQGVREGLLEARWHHICPACRGSTSSAATLAELGHEGRCASCERAFVAERDMNVELAFRPHPDVRKVVETWYCIGGPGVTPHVVYQDELAPGELKQVQLDVEEGGYRVRIPRSPAEAGLVYAGRDFPELAPGDVVLEGPVVRGPDAPAAGPKLALNLRNQADKPLGVLVERTAWLDDLVTPALMDTLPAFMALLPGTPAGGPR